VLSGLLVPLPVLAAQVEPLPLALSCPHSVAEAEQPVLLVLLSPAVRVVARWAPGMLVQLAIPLVVPPPIAPVSLAKELEVLVVLQMVV
jgi:hypothetical protein